MGVGNAGGSGAAEAVSPGLVAFGTLSLVNIGTEPHQAALLPPRIWANEPFLRDRACT